MMNDDAQFTTALAMCQIRLQFMMQGSGSSLQREDIESVVNEVASMRGFASLDRDRLIRVLEERFTVYSPDHMTLDSDDSHVAWLPSRRGAIEWRYWDRYRVFLNRNMPPAAVDSIDRITDDVLERLEDPERNGPWDRRGLVMGNVQSGKTANYCGLICKSADAGYKVIIILSGIHNSLRSQTQIRMDEGFLGFMSEPVAKGQQVFRKTGVGTIDAGIVANTATNRTERGDFSRRVANQFGIHPGGLPLLFVTKKNVSVLKNLNNWISSCTNAEDGNLKRKFVKDVPLLVIDDEADLASIDTNQKEIDEKTGLPDPEHDPSETNKQIRRLLRAFEKAAYVGYTATPFANIFIYDKGYTPRLGDDLFPRSFIVNIPAPSNYMGPVRVFGLSEDADAGLEEVEPLPLVRLVHDHADTAEMDETRGWMPPRITKRTKHIPLYEGEFRIPPSLNEAIMTFILAAVTRKIRDCRPLHNTMLIHVVRFTDVQKRVSQQVEAALKDIRQRLRNGDGDRRPTVLEEFEYLWNGDFSSRSRKCREILNDMDDPDLTEWAEVRDALLPMVESLRVKIINGSAGDVLDYQEYKETGMNVIAIGGDKLSRGLTLEGLSVSYFLRASRMYDTLMQMGRWFGYRDRYIDISRIYMSTELHQWFTDITLASEELRHEFEHMVNVGGRPKDYGLKVRSHPALLVTSTTKMRHGTELRLSYSGDISETIHFKRDPDWIGHNFMFTEQWLTSLGSPAAVASRNQGYTWNDISPDIILEFLRFIWCHEDQRRVNPGLLSKYISTQNREDELTNWIVHLCSSGHSDAVKSEISGMEIGLIRRSPFPSEDEQRPDQYKIRRLVSPLDEQIGLTDIQKDEALKKTIERWMKQKSLHRKKEEPDRPGGREIREIRGEKNGLLLLYAIEPRETMFRPGTKPVIGFAFSFPVSKSDKGITYTVNNVFTQQGGDDESI